MVNGELVFTSASVSEFDPVSGTAKIESEGGKLLATNYVTLQQVMDVYAGKDITNITLKDFAGTLGKIADGINDFNAEHPGALQAGLTAANVTIQTIIGGLAAGPAGALAGLGNSIRGELQGVAIDTLAGDQIAALYELGVQEAADAFKAASPNLTDEEARTLGAFSIMGTGAAVNGAGMAGGLIKIASGGKLATTGIWSAGAPGDPVKNALKHWNDHKADFPEYNNSLDYVQGAHNFVSNPPEGTYVRTRANDGATILWNPDSNIFAVQRADGVPQTMYKIDDVKYPTYNDKLNYFNSNK